MALDKAKALETALSQIEKQFGKGAVMRLGENKHMNVDHISTGSLSLDIALGIGGLPRGRIVEIYGPESSGKTTLSLHCIAEGQKNGGNVAFIDVEHALDRAMRLRWVLTLIRFLSLSPIQARMRLKLLRHSFEAVLST